MKKKSLIKAELKTLKEQVDLELNLNGSRNMGGRVRCWFYVSGK